MRCEHTETLLTGATRDFDLEHLAQCEACSALAARIRAEENALHAVLDSYEAQPPRRRNSFPWRTTLVVLAIAATLALVAWSLLQPPVPTIAPPVAPAIQPIEPSEQLEPTRSEEETRPRLRQPTSSPRPAPSPRPIPPRTTEPMQR